MPKGGARARSGPAPDPNALRRDRAGDAAGWVTLPSEGRTGPIPAFPLVDPSERELELWEALWRLPQATQWDHQVYEVAGYVRCLAEAELPGGKAATWTLVRQYGDSLGLTVSGMARNRWRIADGESAPVADIAPRRQSARERFRVVGDGGS